ncbi:hypothetical protein [Nodularia sphaerocarpa]|uniref:hypothetical protein n=1 Tax=Nodularia sphaerocarpa TaxID=137816 RepID=UPI001EFA4CED|nr:hypothetical protein [Nodularia sphaerocarpa]MDB9374682.1 hypothetical protein [Nodularia sphaerocarpa CS-585]MDB9378859.1 hypothetical protein [Nodularia sphaerocarpa CS-585A2]
MKLESYWYVSLALQIIIHGVPASEEQRFFGQTGLASILNHVLKTITRLLLIFKSEQEGIYGFALEI